MVALGLLAFLGWLMVRSLKRAYDPARLIFKWAISAAVLVAVFAFTWKVRDSTLAVLAPVAALVAGVIFSILWAPHLGALFAKPLTSLYDGGDQEPEPQPFYSIALAKRKKGQAREAVAEVRQQLERFPTDVTGQLLLAEMLVQDLNDLAGAELAIERLVTQPGHSPAEIASALTQLADWQLQYGQDTDAARNTLERIIGLFPDTPLALRATERIAHLRGTAEKIRASAAPQTIPLRPGVQSLGLRDDSAALAPAEPDPAELAAAYVRQLEQHPLDSETREKLALIYADHYQRLDLAADQLEQLIQQPNQSPRQVSRWLNLLADLQIKHAQDFESARATLHRVIALFPRSAWAETAQQRLAHLKLELRGQQRASAVKLGTYEQSLGVKQAIRDAHQEAAKPPTPPPAQPPLSQQPRIRLSDKS